MIPMTQLKTLLFCLVVIIALHVQDRWELRTVPEEAALMEPSVRRRSMQIFRTDRALPPRGAVVWFEHPLLPPRMHVSRVVGRPGDRIAIQGGRIVRNGVPLAEDHVEKRIDAEGAAEIIVPDGHVYLANDGRGEAGSPGADSRRLGPVALAAIQGWNQDRVADRETDPLGPPKKAPASGASR